ncbi:hypothetical protein THASP1DRAFT_27283 [Thamnocephalis sphaerospora]|uniref:Uncharacterized protein n=1 Tax=Thamnocephalis sphaerospora TaxID=78915 RepID=A0A4P9XX22_9FUNG|nr:hypothetical protein THASP1DRAFT_27283 [Thamnocephalis sphaerospora]|eukprot:RKP10918.1 hypothetical protein THASP1DRAFT_27283 [Thamnocephalis sphaerospora]
MSVPEVAMADVAAVSSIDDILSSINAVMLKPLDESSAYQTMLAGGYASESIDQLIALTAAISPVAPIQRQRPCQSLMALQTLGVPIDATELTEIVTDIELTEAPSTHYSYSAALANMLCHRLKQSYAPVYSHQLIDENDGQAAGKTPEHLPLTELSSARYRTTLNIGRLQFEWNPSQLSRTAKENGLDPLYWGREHCARQAYMLLSPMPADKMCQVIYSEGYSTGASENATMTATDSQNAAGLAGVASAHHGTWSGEEQLVSVFDRLVQVHAKLDPSMAYEPIQMLQELARRAQVKIEFIFDRDSQMRFIGILRLSDMTYSGAVHGAVPPLEVRAESGHQRKQDAKRIVAEFLLEKMAQGAL